VKRDAGLDDFTADVKTLSVSGADNVSAMSHACLDSIISVVGTDPCFEAIDALTAAAGNAKDITRRKELAEQACAAMTDAGRSRDLQLAFPDWQLRFRSRVEELLKLDVQSAAVYSAYANFVTGEQHVGALKDAAALAPDDGPLRYRLGLAYMEQQMWSDGIKELEAARKLLPEWRFQVLDEHIEKARKAAAETAGAQ
jgi:hypothetical protein